MKKYLLLLVIASVTGCANKGSDTTKPIGMANPASVYCEQLGGKTEIVEAKEGQQGICMLPSGEKIEEWSLYHRDHQ